MSGPDASRTLRPAVPVDVALTLGVLQRGHADPCVRAAPEGVWLTRRVDADGAPVPASLLVRPAASAVRPSAIRVEAWGPGAQAAVAEAEALLGLHDDGWAAFEDLLTSGGQRLPHHVASARRTRPGLRLPAHGRLAEQLVTVVLEQKVTHDQARHGWRQLVRAVSEPAPGPAPRGMLLPPDPRAVLRVPSWDWHRFWVQPAQAKAILQVAERAEAVDRLGRQVRPGDVAATAELARRLQSLPGIGAWTVAEALQRSHGASDLVAVGDFHLAHHVGQVLTGRRVDDAGMLRLLEPWAGHRQRLVRMIGLSGERRERFGPRLAPEDHRRR
ncbi:DNA-3-methyladenine glycosylase family protein [Micrococcus lylae]|uniref:DNA-3-methyladenine glycosylase family protein n=1 Tax=Micrococcus lylae TaxID=1273 RepID=UPI000C80215F|nr:3-methyladenine DNA glycosylase [Micrococcus lylae]WIK81256.1 3-methyladenine DNA glycosylase [Micrococcus lylae]